MLGLLCLYSLSDICIFIVILMHVNVFFFKTILLSTLPLCDGGLTYVVTVGLFLSWPWRTLAIDTLCAGVCSWRLHLEVVWFFVFCYYHSRLYDPLSKPKTQFIWATSFPPWVECKVCFIFIPVFGTVVPWRCNQNMSVYFEYNFWWIDFETIMIR